jgi:hypothetical protein
MSVHRINYGSYQFGALKVTLKCMNGRLIARVGGGWLQLEEFLRRYLLINLDPVESSALLEEDTFSLIEVDRENVRLRQSLSVPSSARNRRSPTRNLKEKPRWK